MCREEAVMKSRFIDRHRNRGDAVLALGFVPQIAAQQPVAGSGAPPAAVGQDNSVLGTPENPPLSGLDQPSLEPGVSARNFLQPAIQVNQAVDSNVGNDLGDSAVHGVTRVLGSLLLERLWRRYETGLAYVGGTALYSGFNKTDSLIQALEAQQRITWRTGQLVVRDSLDYLPEGSFGVAGAWGLGSLGGGGTIGTIPGLFGSGQFGALGQVPRITNTTLAEIAESLSPRSAVTAAAEYGLVHFNDNSAGYVDSNTVTAQARIQLPDYPQGSSRIGICLPGFSVSQCSRHLHIYVHHIVSLMYGRRISGRMNFLLSAGPQITRIKSSQLPSTDRLTAYGRCFCSIVFPVLRCP